MLHRRPQLAQPAIGIADVVLNIGVRARACGELERIAARPILCDERSFLLRSPDRFCPSASDPIPVMAVQMADLARGFRFGWFAPVHRTMQ